jgi:endonuclease/exonuclease/phosphatase family metal-dependent hydrolase
MLALSALPLFRVFGYITGPLPDEEDIHRLVGEPVRHAAEEAAPARLTIVSWNIERGRRFEAVADVLRSFNADVILLQEVDRFCRRTGYRDVAADLAGALGMNWVTAGEFQEVGEGRGGVPALTGQAILSRLPITDPYALVFTHQTGFRWTADPAQPRRGGRIALRADVAGLTFFNLHLDSRGGDALRRNQLEEVLVHALGARSRGVVVAGDFNNSAGGQSPFFWPMGAAGFVDAVGRHGLVPTSPRHGHTIDWIFARGARRLSGEVHATDGASDHYPVVATWES